MAVQTTNLTNAFWQKVATPHQLLKILSQSTNCASIIYMASAADPGINATGGAQIPVNASIPLFGTLPWWARCDSGDGNPASAMVWATDIAIDLPVPSSLPTSPGASNTWC